MRAQAELAAKQLEFQLAQTPRQESTAPVWSAPKVKLPMFQEDQDDMDAYLARFERYATTQKWKNDEWTTHLSMLLTGKGLQAFVSMSAEDSQDFTKVKETLLRRYMLTEEGFRKKFRYAKPDSDETVQQYVSRLRRYLEKWIELSKVPKTYNSLLDLVLREQFANRCPAELAIHLKDRRPQDMAEMEATAERYLDARSSSLAPRTQAKTTPSSAGEVKPAISSSKPQNQQVAKSKRVCFLCNRPGHIARDCPVYSKVRKESTPRVYEKAGTVKEEKVAGFEEHGVIHFSNGDQMPLVAGVCEAREGLKVVEGHVGDQKVEVLRDTGCTGVVVKLKFVKPEELTGDQKRCVLIDKTVRICKVAKINVDTPYLKGEVYATCLDDAVCDLIIGNVPGATLEDQRKDSLAAAAITRSQAKKSKKLTPLKVAAEISTIGGVDELREAQEADRGLDTLRKHVGKQLRGKGNAKVSLINGILFRHVYQKGEIDQVIVPKSWRPQVLHLAHKGLMGGHLGIKKTIDRVLENFYRPGVYGDIKRYCRSCDRCQRTEPKGRVTKVPLGEVPLIDAPFKKIAVDLVGPLNPVTDRGNRYILTIVDYATRYPEAVAIPSIETERIAEALLEVFARVGLPEEILSDRGAQFTSDLMKEICRLISVKQLHTTPYNPRHNGLNERFNGTLKQMLRRMCQERPRDWDRYLPALMFAYREVPQASTGFSPFELLYGRSVRGPMQILRELWTGPKEHQVQNTYQYIFELTNKLEDTCRIAQESLSEAGERYKHH